MELFKLFGTIAIDNAKANKALDETSEKGNQAQNKLSKAFTNIGKGAVVVGKAVATGLAATGAAVATLAAKSTQAYADYEQLAGGIETLFKNSAGTVMDYANNAFKTAGLSANEYMETVTSFSASLLQSLGGDTEAAAKYADLAITDMSDNANKMGTSMESIQNAYQGFAKQNYTMLDNLKLGYGGTKEEMQRLIDDANKLKKAQGETADLTIDSYADVVEAIHTVQTEMGITGTTAKEAEATISGSIAMTKSAWENLLVGLAQGNADIPQLVNNVVSSASQVLQNIIPVVKQVLQNIPVAISEISPEAGAAMQTVMDFCAAAFPVLIEAVQTAVGWVSSLFNYFKEHTGVLTVAATAIGVIATALALYNAVAAIKAAMAAAEVTTVWGLVAAYAAQAAATIAAIAPYVLIVAAIAAVIAIIVALVKNWDTVKAVCKKTWEAIKTATTAAWESIKSTLSNVWNSIKSTCSSIWNSMKSTVSNIWNSIKSNISSAINNVKSVISSGLNAAKNTVSNVLNSIKSKFTSIWDNCKNIVSNAVSKLKSIMNFSWSLPHLKLPHISISGSFSINPPSVPKFSIAWYKKAMEDGMIMNDPTIFGFNAKTNQFMAGGEAGSETVVGTESLMNMIQRAVSVENAGVADKLDKLISMLANYFPEIIVGMSRQIVLDSGAVVAELAPRMDTRLGIISTHKGRGN